MDHSTALIEGMSNPQSRVRPGISTGGEFAERHLAEADGVALTAPEEVDSGAAVTWREVGFSDHEGRNWRFAGFNDPMHAQQWSDLGFVPSAAREFHDCGFDPETAYEWDDRNITAALAREYLDNGIGPVASADLIEARIDAGRGAQWRESLTGLDIEPEYLGTAAGDWSHGGFTPEQAAGWIEAGIDRPDTARDFERYRFEPTAARGWYDQHFPAPEAREWAEAGFSPAEADHWAVRGFDARSAKSETAYPRTAQIT